MSDIQLKSIHKLDGEPSDTFNTGNGSQSVDSNYGSLEVIIDDKDPNVIKDGEENFGFDVDSNGLRKRKTHDSDDVVEDPPEPTGWWSTKVHVVQTTVFTVYDSNSDTFWTAVYVILAILYFTYFSYAMYYSFGDEGSLRLLVVTVLGVMFFVGRTAVQYCGDKVKCACFEGRTWEKVSRVIYIAVVIVIALFIVTYVIVDVAMDGRTQNLISGGGMLVFILLFYIFSYNPSQVNWRPVFFGLALQFIFALLILRWEFGYHAFKWLGDRVSEFLAHCDQGSEFVFGAAYEHHFFAFKVLPVIVFISTAISVLYYLGVMQFVISNIAWFMAKCMGTSPTESLCAAGNIFIGQTEAPLMIRPFLKDMTRSEIHAVCTGGFATIAGGVMAAYILYEVPANHLLSASVMSAPAALAMAKLFYPETEITKAKAEDVYKMEKGDERNVIEAASRGASMSISLIANIAVNLIAFIAILAFVNATLTWMGHRVGLFDPELTFTLICSYLFYPLAFLMGVDSVDCLRVARLIGIKTFLNEFVAYAELSKYIVNRNNLTDYLVSFNETAANLSSNITGDWGLFSNGDIFLMDLNATLVGGVLTDRSVVIATYALCGFANIGSIGIQLGALGAMAPSRQSDLAQVVVRAMIAGNVACFMTACIAGLLYKGEY